MGYLECLGLDLKFQIQRIRDIRNFESRYLYQGNILHNIFSKSNSAYNNALG